MEQEKHPVFGKVISVYSRAQAIADGVLRDVSELAKEAGFRIPVAVTNTVWTRYITPREADVARGQDLNGRLWDTLYMCYVGCLAKRQSSEILYSVIYLMDGTQETVRLKSVIGPGDAGEPVLTIMLPSED